MQPPASLSSATSPPTTAIAADLSARARPGLRWLLWGALLLLLLVAQALLLWLTVSYEEARAQDDADVVAATAATELRRVLQHTEQALQTWLWTDLTEQRWSHEVHELFRPRPALLRLEWRDARLQLRHAQDARRDHPLFQAMPRSNLELEMRAACDLAWRGGTPTFSRSYFVPQADGLGQEVVDLCLPMSGDRQADGVVVATLGLPMLLDDVVLQAQVRQHELSLVEMDGTRLARAGSLRGGGVYQSTRLVELPGSSLQLRADAAQGRPGLIPNLATALVLGLSLALLALVVALARDMRRRAAAEAALAEALALRRAMENSLVTGLRARDMQGRVTYVNPAFCAMVGWAESELIGRLPPPYWPPEFVAEYTERQAARLQPSPAGPQDREGFETVFLRRNGERFPVMIYEAPLTDRVGHQVGWMSAVLDVSRERRMEELSRQQQERLQATARLATVGEMASLLSHELNQPLAAIASYATGSLNLLDDSPEASAGAAPDPELLPLLRQALQRVAEQAERAGRVIKSVHGFVRRREQSREGVAADQLIEAVLPLVRLQARKSGTRIELDLPEPPMPRVLVDRTMVEQVLLNLTRNGIQAMEESTPLAQRVLVLRVRALSGRWVQFSVIDAGPGIAPEVAARLFTPFFTTRAEGMGLGLSLCRTVIEQHGGALDHTPGPAGEGASGGRGTEFRFTLPAPESPRRTAPPP